MTDHNAIHRQEDSLVIDAHTHLGLEEFIVSEIPEEKLRLPAFQERQEHRVDTLVSAMDRNGVSRAGLTENALQLVLGKNLLTCLGIR